MPTASHFLSASIWEGGLGQQGAGAIVVWLLSQRRRSYKVNAKIQIVFLATRTTATTTTSWIPNTLCCYFLSLPTLLLFPAPFPAWQRQRRHFHCVVRWISFVSVEFVLYYCLYNKERVREERIKHAKLLLLRPLFLNKNCPRGIRIHAVPHRNCHKIAPISVYNS